jgi:hypothetical protein
VWEPPKVNDEALLFELLGWIGTIKLGLPLEQRWLLNELGLYVQLHYAGGWGRLAAGGKYRSYFDARGPEGVISLASWQIRRFERETWDRRFAHLVWPTYEVALLERWLAERALQLDGNTFNALVEQYGRKFPNLRYFRETGVWLGLLDWRCAACNQRIAVWEVRAQVCPACGANLESQSLGTDR